MKNGIIVKTSSFLIYLAHALTKMFTVTFTLHLRRT